VTHISQANVQGNRTLLEMLITNLINNALEHSQSATHIELSVSHHQIIVKDNGAGLSPDKQHALNHVIEAPVKRLDSQGDGLGIGLTICQRIARLHSARLHFDDAKPGLCVTLTF
jgi:two-component system sensor histidine kinase QseC